MQKPVYETPKRYEIHLFQSSRWRWRAVITISLSNLRISDQGIPINLIPNQAQTFEPFVARGLPYNSEHLLNAIISEKPMHEGFFTQLSRLAQQFIAYG